MNNKDHVTKEDVIKGAVRIGKKTAQVGWVVAKTSAIVAYGVGKKSAELGKTAIDRHNERKHEKEKILEGQHFEEQSEVDENLGELDDNLEATRQEENLEIEQETVDEVIDVDEIEVESVNLTSPDVEESHENESEEDKEAEIEEPKNPSGKHVPKHEARTNNDGGALKNFFHRRSVKWISALLVLIIAGSGIAYATVADETVFAKNTFVNGIDVSGMTAEESSLAFNENLNEMNVSRDGEDAKTVKTSFEYMNSNGVNFLIKISHLDPRIKLGKSKLTYKMRLNAAEGVEATAATLGGVYPLEEGKVMTVDAHIDYDAMKIVPAVEGNNTDFTMVAADMAEQRRKKPTKKDFEFVSADYLDVPDVQADDLEGELEFAKKYLSKGLDIEAPNGDIVHANAKQLASVILYENGHAEYSKDGAAELARIMASSYKPSVAKIMTQEGEKTLNNYAIAGAIDQEKSAESIIKAAKEGGTAKIYADKSKSAYLGDHVEVSVSSQTLYLVQNDEVTLKSPVVTGNYGHDTPKGIFKLAWKASPSVLKGKNDDGSDYESPVTYWMPFNGGIGLHDATWRGSFGGNIYRGNGSHGCVNLPYNTAKKVYGVVSSGYIIIVY